MKIKKLHGTITKISDLSETAKEVTIHLSEPLGFIAGSFVNIFMTIDGQKVRRAYSISSSDTQQELITLSIRRTRDGIMSPLFWEESMVGTTVEIMGPLGLNTVDTMHRSKVFLFAFGIGAGVVKSIAEHLSHRDNISGITIMTGSRHKDDIIYKEYFDELAQTFPFITTTYVTSEVSEDSPYKKGYIQNHIESYDFNHADIYMCGQEVACNQLQATIHHTNPTDCEFFVEGFH